MGFFKTLFSKVGILIALYVIVGIIVGPPAGNQFVAPTAAGVTGAQIVHWVQVFIWVMFWPIGLIFHHPTFSL